MGIENTHVERVTLLLTRMQDGAPEAEEELYEIVYADLRRLAHTIKFGNSAKGTVSVVHEAWERMQAQKSVPEDRTKFLRTFALMIRRVLHDYHDHVLAQKRGGGVRAAAIDDGTPSKRPPLDDLIDVSGAIRRLEVINPDLAAIVDHHHFLGFTLKETADLLSKSYEETKRGWSQARAWLRVELKSLEQKGGEEERDDLT